MLITGLISLIVSLLSVLLPSLALEMPASVSTAVSYAMEYIEGGVSFLAYVLGRDTLRAMGIFLSLIIDIEIFLAAWDLAWFVVKKIPLFNVRE